VGIDSLPASGRLSALAAVVRGVVQTACTESMAYRGVSCYSPLHQSRVSMRQLAHLHSPNVTRRWLNAVVHPLARLIPRTSGDQLEIDVITVGPYQGIRIEPAPGLGQSLALACLCPTPLELCASLASGTLASVLSDRLSLIVI